VTIKPYLQRHPLDMPRTDPIMADLDLKDAECGRRFCCESRCGIEATHTCWHSPVALSSEVGRAPGKAALARHPFM